MLPLARWQAAWRGVSVEVNQLHSLRMASTTQQSLYVRAVRVLSVVVAACFMQACAVSATDTAGASDTPDTPDTPDVVATETPPLAHSAPEPEFTLNLPAKEDCLCPGQPDRDFTFLEKGMSALAANDFPEAVSYFQRYQRIESSPAAQWEAAVAMAYTSMVPQNPAYDLRRATNAYAKINHAPLDAAVVHDQVLMMRDALETLVTMQKQIDKLQGEKAALAADLVRLAEALRRLRELALGQKAVTP